MRDGRLWQRSFIDDEGKEPGDGHDGHKTRRSLWWSLAVQGDRGVTAVVVG